MPPLCSFLPLTCGTVSWTITKWLTRRYFSWLMAEIVGMVREVTIKMSSSDSSYPFPICLQSQICLIFWQNKLLSGMGPVFGSGLSKSLGVLAKQSIFLQVFISAVPIRAVQEREWGNWNDCRSVLRCISRTAVLGSPGLGKGRLFRSTALFFAHPSLRFSFSTAQSVQLMEMLLCYMQNQLNSDKIRARMNLRFTPWS